MDPGYKNHFLCHKDVRKSKKRPGSLSSPTSLFELGGGVVDCGFSFLTGPGGVVWCLRLQFKVKVLLVKVMNPRVSVFSSTAVTVNNNRRHTLAATHTRTSLRRRCGVLPLAVGVECHAVDGAEVTFDPAELLFVGSVEEPEERKKLESAPRC